jgi:hypothetical protein
MREARSVQFSGFETYWENSFNFQGKVADLMRRVSDTRPDGVRVTQFL